MSSTNRSRKSKDIDNIQSEVRDIKKEMLKTSEKSLPTAEQMRIAEIIDTKTEDPALKEKVKQVMDATQKSLDEAFIALHDCDNDPNRAVNMLLEGIGSEWSTSSKKKKNRTKEKPPSTPEISPSDVSRDSLQNIKHFGSKQVERRGRGRGFRGNRSDLSNSFTERDRRDANGPSRERGGRGRNQFRDFGRGRGSFRKPIETWDPYTPGGDSKSFEPDPDDWDNEEYTGSLANSLIITSSSTGNTPPPVNPTPYLNEKNSDSDVEKKSPLESFIVKPSISQSELTPLTAVYYKQYTSAVNETALPVNLSMPPVRGNLVATPEKSIRPIPITGQEIRQTRPPKIPPPSKIPSGPVEMPPDSADNNIGLLDVQFGALELENSSETISPPPPHHTPSPTISDKQLHHQVGSPNEGLLLNEPTTSFSPVRSSATIPHIPELVTKVSDVTSSLYPESTYQTPSSSTKTTQASNTSNYTTTYPSGQVNSTSSIIYSSNSSQNTYTSAGVYGGSSNSYPHYQYSGYPSQQPHTLQMLAGSSNSYQSVLGSQQYGSNTQTAYGASGIAPPVYPSQYQTYNSNIQHIYKQTMAPPSSTSSKDYDTNQPTVNLTAISHSGSMSPTSTFLSASNATTKPSSLSSSMGKSGMVTNLPPSVPALVGAHQYIMGQGTIPYFQQPMFYEDLQLMPQQRLTPHIGATGYYEMGYQTSGTRDGYQYGMTDGRFARADTTSGTGTTTGHGASNSGVYGKMPTPFTANYGVYDNSQVRGNAGDFKSNQALPKGVNPLSSSDSSGIYPKSHTGLPKVSAYEAQGYHGGPPMGSHPGLGPGDGYAQHVFIPTMAPHRAATLMQHQPMHQDGGLNPRSAPETQQNKVGITKATY